MAWTLLASQIHPFDRARFAGWISRQQPRVRMRSRQIEQDRVQFVSRLSEPPIRRARRIAPARALRILRHPGRTRRPVAADRPARKPFEVVGFADLLQHDMRRHRAGAGE